ncbi:hypothetical protein BDV39DRAFT_212334 [Aspergillus sergii]|uniref:NADH dehydrogenase [ubiquinone] 1 beta subcomplex subunit 9 n=1 Tax=Aspergillus sergii TaxID=1034303 RepID=A0A5N6WNT1_9EURO|nr:hypothetical protein BDV39DRAFT_212334 [Aspergillus sergii]
MALHPVASLYRRSLKLALDWAVHRQIWRGQAVYIRSLFDANKNVRDPRQQKKLGSIRTLTEHPLPQEVTNMRGIYLLANCLVRRP